MDPIQTLYETSTQGMAGAKPWAQLNEPERAVWMTAYATMTQALTQMSLALVQVSRAMLLTQYGIVGEGHGVPVLVPNNPPDPGKTT